MEPKPDSFWWTSTYKAEDGVTLGGRREENWMPFGEAFDLLGCRFRMNWKGIQGTERRLKQRLGRWRDAHIRRKVCRGGPSV